VTGYDPINFKSGDIFFGLDFSRPIVIAQRNFYQALRAQGVTTCFLVHDLLPICMPHYFPEGVRDLHGNWLEVISQSDALFSVSKNTAQELKKWILKNVSSNTQRPQLHWFHLGADIKSSIPNSGLPLDAKSILKQMQEGLTFLMVGTLEPRKGYIQTLEAFELLWQRGFTINLVIAGKYGWMMEDFVSRLKNHPYYKTRLFWIDHASDEYLQALYNAATCLIFASEGEGFGLPLIEAAHHELPVIARDIPVFREVAGSHVHYFSGLQATDLMETINEWINLLHQGLISSSSNRPKHTWEQSAIHLLSNILSL
jgi:glycosyltransferase involved in cell wall biosynthesis